MNDDHADALVAYCRVFGDRPGTATAEMVGVDRYGFTMLAADEGATDQIAVRIPFGRRVDTPGAVRAAMIELLHEARAAQAAPLHAHFGARTLIQGRPEQHCGSAVRKTR